MQQGLVLRLLCLLLSSSYFPPPELIILHKLLGIFTINLVSSQCHMIPQLGKVLEGGHCGDATILLEGMSNKLAKNLNVLFYFYSSIWHVTLLSERKILKVLGRSFDWLNVAQFRPFLVKRNDTVWRCLYHILSR